MCRESEIADCIQYPLGNPPKSKQNEKEARKEVNSCIHFSVDSMHSTIVMIFGTFVGSLYFWGI